MLFEEVCKLITNRSDKLRSLREQAINGNDDKKRLFVTAILHLIKNPTTQEPAFEQITLFMISASPFIVKALANEVIAVLPQTQKKLNEHKILWSSLYDGSMQKKDYPNIRAMINGSADPPKDVNWSSKFKQYVLQFQKQFNQRTDLRVEFFQDDSDSIISDSIDEGTKENIILCMHIEEMKITRKKMQSQNLSEAAMNEQLNKIRHFLSLKLPSRLAENQARDFQKQRKWAADFIRKQQHTHFNPSNQSEENFNLSKVEERIQIVDKDQFAMRRTLKETAFNKPQQYFKDSLDMRSEKVGSKLNNPNINDLITPVKFLPDNSRDGKEIFSSKNSSVAVFNENYSNKFKAQYLRVQERELEEQGLPIENLVVHKYKGGNLPITEDKQYATHFGFGQIIPNLQLNPSPFQSETLNSWKKKEYLSPTKNSRCKLSEFTSEKKKRKQLAPKSKLSFPEEFYIKPYLCNFTKTVDFCGFRRNCFQSSFILYSGGELIVTCLLNKDVNCRIQLQVLYINQAQTPLEVESVYKIPKCFRVQKNSKISKRFQLHNNLKHVFSLQVQQFPLDPCMLNIKYRAVDSGLGGDAHIPMPITILNFIQYLHFSEEEWIRGWDYLNEKNNREILYLVKHIEADRQIVGEELEWILRQVFVKVGFCEGYSIQDYGCWCSTPALSNLKFMVRLSLRVDSIVSIELKSAGPVTNSDNEFMQYCINIWMMLLTKLHF